MAGVLFTAREDIFLVITTARPALRPPQPRIQWVPRALSPGLKRQGHEADHSPPTSAKVKKTFVYAAIYQYVLWRSG
jgi:hypothetical protein